jgi:hypothetical protein
MVLVKFNERICLDIRESFAASREQFVNPPSPLLLKRDPPGKKSQVVFLPEKHPTSSKRPKAKTMKVEDFRFQLSSFVPFWPPTLQPPH